MSALKHGEISDHSSYTTDELARRGIGRQKLAEARDSGLVVPMFDGRSYWYDGSEIRRWLKTRAVEEGRLAKQDG